MLSILIPVYNYPIATLLEGLSQSIEQIDFNVEILCLEDGSTQFVDNNKSICSGIKHASHIISQKNKGRITSRKHLAAQAKYSWLLFLDADVQLKDNQFLKNYSSYFKSDFEAIYGGCTYDVEKPIDSKLLRWKYGKAYEDIEASLRNKSPYKYIVSANFLIEKTLLKDLFSYIEYEGYGYDILLGALMKSNNTRVLHINNPVIHKGLDDNNEFFNKVRKAVETSYMLHRDARLKISSSSLIKTFNLLKKLGLVRLVSLIFKFTKSKLSQNLLGINPNIKLLQFYKLGYLCAISSKE
jgi:hypothetical protein